MSAIRYQTAGNVRKRAHNVNETLWTTSEINGLIDRHSIMAHIKAGRPLSSKWADGTDDEYEVVRTYVLNASACEIMAGLEIDPEDVRTCERLAKDAMDTLIGGGGSVAIVKAGWDLIDGVDEDQYSRQF